MYKNILIPIVLDDGHDTQASYLAGKALASEGAQITVIHVMDPIPAYAATQIPAEIMANSRHEVEEQVAQSARAIQGAKAVLTSGHPSRTILDYAEQHGCDCIILASHRPGLENLLIGSTAEKVVRHAKCSVHVIR